ncbi:hypothetical protein SAMN05443572_109282 [Myxococcus fulvus]|uniref:Lipoprotein n=1 Tax=Myxococcus fulvus TaxID=33 RepID=A0ABY1CR24_MYXFU|nr:hypothetical protein [Myxococcus fulvus]SEU33402.1 hypothetical protein SAMN05443572_109282 [Myxococcus fulvus]
MHLLQVQAPLDVELNDHLLSICVNRPLVANCDYRLTGSSGAVLVPLQGSISIASSLIFDEPSIAQLRLVLSYAGNGRDVTQGNTLSANMAQFWNSVSRSSDRPTHCRNNQSPTIIAEPSTRIYRFGSLYDAFSTTISMQFPYSSP